MSYLKVKSGHLDFSGLKLEESDVDREEICSERLCQLLTMQNIIDSLPLTQNTVASQIKSSVQPSIPSSKATRFGILSKSWNFPKIEFVPRQICRSADFYETRFRKPTRYSSAPDLPQISKSEEVKLPFILKFSKKNSAPIEDFFIQGRNLLTSEETEEEQDLNHHQTTRPSHLRTPNSTVPAHAPSKFVHTTNNYLIKMSKDFDGERKNFEMEFPLTARQCFPSTKTQRNCEKNSTEKNTKNKIQPMERKLNSKFNKYVQCRFGRSLGPSKEHLKTFAHAHSLDRGDWEKHGGKVKKRNGIETVAMEKVVEKIMGCQEKDHGNDYVTGQQRVEFLSCSGLELNPLNSAMSD